MDFNATKHLKDCLETARGIRGSKAKAIFIVDSNCSAFMGESYTERVKCLLSHGWTMLEASGVADKIDNLDRWKLL